MDSFSSSNALSLEERARLVRSARKLEQVLGSKAFLLKSSNARHVLPSVRPKASHARALTETDMYAAQTDAGCTPRRRRIESTTRRQASIFDLTEEQLLALGIKHHPGTLRNLSIEDVPRPSTDSAPSSAYTSDASDASSFFERGYVSATSSSRTSFETEFCPPAPTRSTFTSMASSDRSKSPRRKRGEIPPLLFASTSNEPSAYPREIQAVPLAPRTAPCNPPKTPAAPVARIGSGTAYHRSRKSSKVAPMPDTKAPVVQAFPARTPKTRRASLTGVVDSRAINPSPLAALRPSYDTDDDAVFSGPSEPSRFIASLKRRRARPAVPSSQEQYSSCQDSLGDGFSITAPHSYPDVNHNEVRPAIFGSGPRQRAEDQWVGSWNRPDIYTVQSDLRALRQR